VDGHDGRRLLWLDRSLLQRRVRRRILRLLVVLVVLVVLMLLMLCQLLLVLVPQMLNPLNCHELGIQLLIAWIRLCVPLSLHQSPFLHSISSSSLFTALHGVRLGRPAPSPGPGHELDWVEAQTAARPGPQQDPGVDPVAGVAAVAGRWDGAVALPAYWPHGMST